jgi:hypothetical protein
MHAQFSSPKAEIEITQAPDVGTDANGFKAQGKAPFKTDLSDRGWCLSGAPS